MQRQHERSLRYVGLTVNQHYLTDFQIFDLDPETATLIRDFHGSRLLYREIAQRLYKECRSQEATGRALSRIAGRLKRGREKILAAKPSEADLDKYPQIVRKAILSILANYAPVNDIDPKNGQSEMAIAEETPSKDDDGSSLHAEEIPAIISVIPSAHPNSCLRCGGTMLFEEDIHGAFSTCLSCGYVYEPNNAYLESNSRRRNPSHDGKPL